MTQELAPTVEILYGAEIDDVTERRFLNQVAADVTTLGQQAIILANFHVGAGRQRRQIDFVVATSTSAVVVEVKGFTSPVLGGVNGPWTLQGAGANRSLGPTNPYNQALTARFGVCDALRATSGGTDFRNGVAGCLCLYPAPIPGSVLPDSDLKLCIGGYAAFLTLLSAEHPGSPPLEMWRGLAKALGLSPQVGARPQEQELLDGYLDAYLDLRRATRRPFVEPRTASGEGFAQVAARLVAGEQLHLVGPSGSGKSELLGRLADATAERGDLPVMLNARDFQGDLGVVLRRATAKASAETSARLLEATNRVGREAILFVDGLNECSEARRIELLEALQAARLRYQLRVVTSGQTEVTMPLSLQGDLVRLSQPDVAHAQAIVEAHLERPLVEDEATALEVVATAHDAAILADVIEEGPAARNGRYALYHAFTRLRTRSAPADLHAGLGSLAARMRAKFATTLPVAAVERELSRGGRSHLSGALASGLLATEEGRVRFRHDLIADFYAAQHVLTEMPDSSLGQEAARPLNTELHEFLVGGCATTAQAETLLGCVQNPTLQAACAAGRCGQIAMQVVHDRCQDAVEALTSRYTRLTLALPEGFESIEQMRSLAVRFESDAPPPPPAAHLPILHVVEHAEPEVLDSLLQLFRKVDIRIQQEADRLKTIHPEVRLAWRVAGFNAVYGVTGDSESQHLADLLEAANVRQSSVISDGIAERLDCFEDYSPGQLFLLIALLRRQRGSPMPRRFNELLRHVWGLRIYHLRLAMEYVVRFRGRDLPDKQREQVRESLTGWLSENDAWTNMIIFDALEGVGGLEPDFGVDSAVAEYRALLELHPGESAKSCTSSVIQTWDHPFAETYYEAFHERLTTEERQEILLRGLQEPEIDAMFLADLLRYLHREPPAQTPDRLFDMCVAPWGYNHSQQDAVRVYAGAIALLASMRVPLRPTAEAGLSEAEIAWARAAPLIYAFNADEGTVSSVELQRRWDDLEACGASAAFDVIVYLQRELAVWEEPRVKFLDHFPSGLLRLARQVLEPGYVAESVFERWRADDREQRHRSFALQLLGRVGRRSDLDLLKRWSEHAEHGRHAIEAARMIESR